MVSETGWSLHPDRALPSDPVVRPIAREILAATATLPIVSMHGHVDAGLLARDEPFADPASLLVTPDHYLVRMLVSQGVPHDALGVPRRDRPGVVADPREVWRTFATHWPLFRGTPTRYWLEHVFVEVFGLDERPSADSADRLFDLLSERLEKPAFRPLALFDEFGIEILATTDAATATLADHADLAERGWGERIVPTFRPDALLHVDRPGWQADVALLEERSGVAISGYRDLVHALEERRRAFVAAGARATDHGHLSADTTPLSDAEAERIVSAALRGDVGAADAQAFSGHMLFEMARMSAEDGLVMQLHPGVLRDHDRAVADLRGPDVGYDIPVTHRVRARPAAGPGGVRPPPRSATGPVHGGRGHVQPRAGADRRRVPGRAAGRAVVVPRHPGRHAALPRGGDRHGRVRQHHGVRRRHARVLLDPRAARPGPAHRRRLPRPARRGAPARRRRGDRDGGRPRLPDPASGVCSTEDGKRFPASSGSEHGAKEHK